MSSFSHLSAAFTQALSVLPLAGLFTGALLVLFFRIAEVFSGKTFFNHMARQSLQCVVACGLLFAILLGVLPLAGFLPAAAPGTAMRLPGISLLFSGPQAFYALAAASVICALLALVCLALWRKTRQFGLAQILFAALVCAAALIFVWLLYCAASSGFYGPLMQKIQTLLSSGFLAVQTVLDETPSGSAVTASGAVLAAKLAFCSLVATLLSLGTALGACWLLLRRNCDDYGRDYYNFALARICLVGCLLAAVALVCVVGYFFIADAFTQPDAAVMLALTAGPLAICLTIMAFTARSRTALRQKPLLWLTLPLMILAVAMLGALGY